MTARRWQFRAGEILAAGAGIAVLGPLFASTGDAGLRPVAAGAVTALLFLLVARLTEPEAPDGGA